MRVGERRPTVPSGTPQQRYRCSRWAWKPPSTGDGRASLSFSAGSLQPGLATLVAGDEAADFALALAWDRLYGRSLWLPSDWQPSLDV